MSDQQYRGRFAPSPTGSLHVGTLIAAVGSCLQARSQNGEWLLRIENVDTTREVAGMADEHIRTLEQFGFQWDGEVVYQSERTGLYQQALEHLLTKDLLYPCTCSRKQLLDAVSEENDINVYPGYCNDKLFPCAEEHAIRLRCDDETILFTDAVTGLFAQDLKTECGDFVIKRRDGLFAYQLAVVVDDHLQGVTEVVRGADLLDSTPRQIFLQQCLGYNQPDYLHLPLAIDRDNKKISKSAGASALDPSTPVKHLVAALDFLGQQPDEELEQATVDEFWQWAIAHWDKNKIPSKNRTV